MGQKGILYGVGVGPGDPELLTCKAVRILQEVDVIAVPAKRKEESAAYKIAIQILPQLSEKRVLEIDLPMTRDPEILRDSHRKGAGCLAAVLETGDNIAFITIGDPTVYSTYTYLHQRVCRMGYETHLVNGVTSFCAAAAGMNIPLAEGTENILIEPGSPGLREELKKPGTHIIMKSGKRMQAVYEILRELSKSQKIEVRMGVNCGYPNEKYYEGIENLPETAPYFSVLVVKV